MEIREAGASLAILSEAQDSCVDSRLPASAAMAGEETPGVPWGSPEIVFR